jgi:hypothetical protein
MRSLFDHLKQNYLAVLSRLPDFAGHFTMSHPMLAANTAATTAPAEAMTGPIGAPSRTSAIAWAPRRAAAPQVMVISGRASISR